MGIKEEPELVPDVTFLRRMVRDLQRENSYLEELIRRHEERGVVREMIIVRQKQRIKELEDDTGTKPTEVG